MPEHGDHEPDDRHLAGAEPRDQLLRGDRADDDPGREREEREAGLDRRVAEHALHEQRVEEEHREQPAGDDEHRDVRAAHRADGEDREAHERLGGAVLDHDEADQEHGGERRGCRAPRRSPSPVSAERTIP